MKLRISFLLAILCLSIPFLQANNGNPSSSTVSSTAETSYPLDNIFYNDFENSAVFIDFEAITDDLIMINLFRDGQLMMEDDVTDLPGNSIYEYNTEIFRTGKYTIELVTLQGVKIHKEIAIE